MKNLNALSLAVGLIIAPLTTTPAMPSADAATVLTLPGAFGSQSHLLKQLKGVVINGNAVKPVNYNNYTVFQAQVDQGAALLNEQLLATSGPKIVFGSSLGALVANNWLSTYGPTSTIPPSDLTVVEIGDSERRYGGYLNNALNNSLSKLGFVSSPANTPPVPTLYTMVDVAQQYDGWADWPNVPTSPYYRLAVRNAKAGKRTLHPNYDNVNPNDPNNLVYQQGNITYVLVPTTYLPVLGARGRLNPSLNAKMKVEIETAYNRPETETAAAQGITEPLVPPTPPPLNTSLVGPVEPLTESATSAPLAVKKPRVTANVVKPPLTNPPATAIVDRPAPTKHPVSRSLSHPRHGTSPMRIRKTSESEKHPG